MKQKTNKKPATKWKPYRYRYGGPAYLARLTAQLRARRNELGLSCIGLDEKLGTTDGLVQKLETGERGPGAFLLHCWAEALECSLLLVPKDMLEPLNELMMEIHMAGPQSKWKAKGFRDDEGTWWHSHEEYCRWLELQRYAEEGRIKPDIERQKRIDLTHPDHAKQIKLGHLVVDYAYRLNDDTYILEDWKGYFRKGDPATRLATMKHRLVEMFYGWRVYISGPGQKHVPEDYRVDSLHL